MKQLLAFFICFLLFLNSNAQNYYNQEISKLYNNKIIKKVHYSKKDTLVQLDINIGNQLINYRVILKKSRIDHIGIKLFPDSVLLQPNNLVYKFIERKFLQYALINETDSIGMDLKLCNSFLMCNNIQYGSSGFTNFSIALNTLNNVLSYEMYSDSSKIFIKIRGNKSELIFAFKKNFNLISGLNKIEADDLLLNDLNTYSAKEKDNNNKIVGNSEMSKFNDSVFSVYGNEYMHLLSGSYYIIKYDTAYKPLFDKNYPVKSFITSIIQPENNHQINIILTHKQYKYDKKLVLVLSNVINYLKKEHELYFGIEDTSSSLSGTLIAYNRNLNYLHLFYFTTDKKTLFSSNPEYLCKLYTYIPTDNIKNLFLIEDDIKSTKKKGDIHVK